MAPTDSDPKSVSMNFPPKSTIVSFQLCFFCKSYTLHNMCETVVTTIYLRKLCSMIKHLDLIVSLIGEREHAFRK